MKRLIALVSVLALSLCLLSGCGQEQKQSTDIFHDQDGGIAEAMTGSELVDGTYSIVCETDSSMFRVEECQIQVANGGIDATVTLAGKGFDLVYCGSAADANEADALKPVGEKDGRSQFLLKGITLNEEQHVAGHGADSGNWYDHTMLFLSNDLPDSAYK